MSSNKKAKLFQIDAFTKVRFKGNPAGVCILPDDCEISDEWMQSIAMEMNLSETAFVRYIEEKEGSTPLYSLRWFTPELEVPLCGHATLATSHVLFEHEGIEGEKINYKTKSGLLKTKKEDKGIRLDFPIGEPKTISMPNKVMGFLGIEEKHYKDVKYCKERAMLIVGLKNEKTLRTLKPNFQKMKEWQPAGDDKVGTLIVTTLTTTSYDFISRCFAPWDGIDEDPVTGSAHTVLAPYWSNVLNKNTFHAYQASNRGGELKIAIINNRVQLLGSAVSIFETEIEL